MTLNAFGKIDILVNHLGIQTVRESIQDITPKQLHETFKTNVYSMFYFTQAALPHIRHNGSIINSACAMLLALHSLRHWADSHLHRAATSINAYRGHASLIDYSATKGAQVSFTYSLAQSPEVLEKNIRVNAVAPGPIWTPLIVSTFPKQKVGTFGKEVPMQRPGQPEEVAACFVFLASNVDASFMTGQVLHPNGGVPIHG
jgi:NAD(P)-dependent dehydrogenase (short-subunit alcohol dehydrogenase family)